VDKDRDCYSTGDAPFTYAVEVCYLTDTGRAEGSVSLELPAGWSATPASAPVSLDAMGRAVLEFTVTPAVAVGKPARITVRPDFAGLDVQPSVSAFRMDMANVKPTATQDLGLGDPARWVRNISGNGHMEITSPEPGVVRSDIHFTAPGDRWCYPQALFTPPADFSGWQGVEYEFRCHGDDGETAVRTQVVEASGASYLDGGRKATKEWTTARLAFEDLGWGPFSTADPNGRLDLNAIGTLMIGINTPRDEARLEVRNVRLIRFTE
jgi:hypothetical protein